MDERSLLFLFGYIQSDTKKNLKKVHQFEANINGLGLSIKVS